MWKFSAHVKVALVLHFSSSVVVVEVVVLVVVEVVVDMCITVFSYNRLSKKKACKVCFKGAQGSSSRIENYYLYTKKIFTWKFDNSSCDF